MEAYIWFPTGIAFLVEMSKRVTQSPSIVEYQTELLFMQLRMEKRLFASGVSFSFKKMRKLYGLNIPATEKT